MARGSEAADIVEQAVGLIQESFGSVIYGEDDDQLHSVIVQQLTKAGKTLALAESCTGGFLAHRITNVPGASTVLESGMVTYSNAAKVRLLGVSEQTLEEHGAVSKPTAKEMAEGAGR